MYFLNFIVSILIGVCLYTVLAIILKIPSFSVSGDIGKRGKTTESKKPINAFIKTLSLPLAKYMPVSIMKETKLKRILQSNGTTETAKQFVSRLVVTFILIALLAIPLYFIWSWLSILPLIAAVITVVIIYSETKDKAINRTIEIEKELPRFIQTYTESAKTNRNVIDIIESYRLNFKTELTNELAITVADMRTGSPELALQRLEARINSPLMSELIRAILANMRGENMQACFDALVIKVKKTWQQQLTTQALKIKPKIAAMSIVRAIWSIVILIVVVLTAIKLLSSQGGLL
ncbi:hypothetical protein RBG61_06555 [Paludicola sp. MB14-C6]|uniref:hypothetical protein n=1 Tax=Paludihabitans sp. MB14-C6 TaxID=3070656 RepID=UPI0027DB65A5|nr:hypothetical protein [Paludicola sp. MB14-C6]WMJ24322.1 hypothetical protein RBG61_06555 [Paludicola sp. MB14-C6]